MLEGVSRRLRGIDTRWVYPNPTGVNKSALAHGTLNGMKDKP